MPLRGPCPVLLRVSCRFGKILTGAKYRTPYNVGTARTSLLRSAYLRRYLDNPHVHALKVGNQQGVEPRSLITRYRKVAQKCRPGERAVHEQSDPSCQLFLRGALALLPSRPPLAAPSFSGAPRSRMLCAAHRAALRAYTCSACIHMLLGLTRCSPPRHLLASLASGLAFARSPSSRGCPRRVLSCSSNLPRVLCTRADLLACCHRR